MSRSTCPSPILVGTKSMNNQQHNQPTNNQANQTGKVERLRLSGAARKRFHYLVKKGMSTEEAKVEALKPMNWAKSQRHRAIRKPPNIVGINMSGQQPDYESGGIGWAEPAGVPPIPAATQMHRIPVQARLGAPVKRITPVQSEYAETPPTVDRSGPLDLVRDNDPTLNVAILPGDYPSELWTTPQLEAVQQSIIELVRRQSEGSAKPVFSQCIFRKGWLSVRGNDVNSVNWLMAMDTRLRPWEGASLKVMPESEVPLKRVFVGLFPALETTSIKYALRLIDDQNEGLAVEDWRVLQRAQRGPIMKLALSIDSHSAELLRRRRYHLNYGFTSVQLRPKETAK